MDSIVEKKLEKLLFAHQDKQYRLFSIKITPGVVEDTFIGVRVPIIKSLLKEFSIEEQRVYLSSLPHKYFEEILFHDFILQKWKNYDETIKFLDEFLPYINNWCTCDTIRPKCFEKHKSEAIVEIYRWLKSDHLYTVRFAIEMLMNFYLDKDYKEEYLHMVANIKSDEYYLNMMIAWYIATALAKQWDSVIKLIEAKTLSPWVQNKSIQKARESFRITSEQKEYLKTLKL